MRRTSDAAFFPCPICGKKPYVKTHDVNVAWAFCKGYGFHRHNKVRTNVVFEQPSKLLKKLAEEWNQKMYEEARFLFYPCGNPFKEDEKDENARGT